MGRPAAQKSSTRQIDQNEAGLRCFSTSKIAKFGLACGANIAPERQIIRAAAFRLHNISNLMGYKTGNEVVLYHRDYFPPEAVQNCTVPTANRTLSLKCFQISSVRALDPKYASDTTPTSDSESVIPSQLRADFGTQVRSRNLTWDPKNFKQRFRSGHLCFLLEKQRIESYLEQLYFGMGPDR